MERPGVSPAPLQTNPTPNRQPKDPLSYSQAIRLHSERVKDTSSYPGVNYRRLALFLQGSPHSKKPALHAPAPKPFQFVALHNLAVDVSDAKRVRGFDGNDDLTDFENFERPQADSGQLIFLRGYPSPSWLNVIGIKYRIDPEFFRQHLSLGPSSEFFDLPSLPSSSRNIINLNLISIGRWNIASSKHQDAVDAMQNHFWQMRTTPSVGESIVRRFTRHDEEHFTMEQNASVCVSRKGSGWVVLIMLDNGRNIAEDPEGPYAKLLGTHQLNDAFLPTLRFKPKIALEGSTPGVLDSEVLKGSNSGIGSKPKTFQSASLLHNRSYGYYLDHATMQVDAFYALHDLFLFSAYAENHFLNLVQMKLTTESQRSNDMRHSEQSLQILKRYQRLLHDHAQQLRNTIKVIQKRGDADWPRAKEEPEIKEAERAALSLQGDFEELEYRAKALLQQCGAGMEDVRNSVILSESRQAMGQQSSVARLSFLAFLFIPLSFTTSFFGMNFKELGNGMSIWAWFAVSIPVFLLASILGFWDVIYSTVQSFLNPSG